jgi:uncharacterized protein involved in outer membrane biogenesis
MKKLVKVLFGIVIALVALVLIAVFTLPLWISPVVKQAASVGGPMVLGVPVSVGGVSLSPLSGSMTISQLSIGNPKGYSDKPAFAVDKVQVGLQLSSLLGDTITVKTIQIHAPNISFESKDGVSNFDALLANAKKSERQEKAKAPGADKDKKPAKKVVIETFELNGAKVSCTASWTFGKPITLPLPPVTMRDIGKSSGGTTPVEAVTEIFNQITASLGESVTALAGKANGALKDVLKGASGLTNGASGSAKGAADALKGAAGGAEDAVKDAAKSLKNLFK